MADYQKWADEAAQNGQQEVAESLSEAAKLTSAVTEKFRQALGRIKA
ncbi:hypothetical protein LJC71_07140 [Desulfosarcina sp. OttesenSCG-928-A07]|nr:hypothetical protein [Desulfosarcina sp. OttesenSCG-928-A07]